MENIEIKSILMNALSIHKVYVTGQGNFFKIIAVDDKFSEMSRLTKQQFIYKPLMEYIVNNIIHALVIKTYTTQEWYELNNPVDL
ncbi:MAG: BolA/IbaG family iron-sulfur metabolism protein [Candidatus Dasytiphilus stammeri]